MVMQRTLDLSFEEPGQKHLNPYERPIKSTRGGPIFQVHPYPTKIHHRGIMPFILAHTEPGDVVYDCFAGTCSTGIAAAACAEPDPQALEGFPDDEKSTVQWGRRQSVCLDLGVLPTFIGRTLLSVADDEAFRKDVERVLDNLQEQYGWIYEAEDPQGKEGRVRHIYWSEMTHCTSCRSQHAYADLFVDFDGQGFLDTATCPDCNADLSSDDMEPVMEEVHDNILGQDRKRRARVPVRVYGITDGNRWQRPANQEDLELLERIQGIELPGWVEPIEMLSGQDNWGEMYRSGYHRDIEYVHDFYTYRNFLALALLFDAADQMEEAYRDHFRLLVSSYNVAHSTLMTRFVFKSSQDKPVNTSAQPGALYIPSCPVEKNVFQGVRRKLPHLQSAVEKISAWSPDASVLTRPAQDSGLPANSVDYIFTDPPFGKNIQYSEINFLSEAWFDSFTDDGFETIISSAQDKDVAEYEKLLTEAFRENLRVLKSGHYMTVVFHNTSKKVWNALRSAILDAGFDIVRASVLDKDQTSFKQTTTSGAVKKDPVILARKPTDLPSEDSSGSNLSAEEFVTQRLQGLDSDGREREFDYLFSRYVGARVTQGDDVDLDASEFREVLQGLAVQQEGRWYLQGEVQ